MSFQARPKVTIHEVAAAAGVSIKTVSRVIRDEPKASEATRQAVREAIRQLGYVPHASASALSSSVTPVVGLLSLSLTEPSMLRAGYEYRMSMQVGAFAACQAVGFGLSLVRLSEQDRSPHFTVLIDRVRRREIGGFLIPSPLCERKGLLPALRSAGAHFATISSPAGLHDGPSVVANDREAMRAMTQLVLQHGHRRIAFIRGNAGWRDAEQRYAGYVDALAAAGLTLDQTLVAQGAFAFDAGRQCGQHLLSLSRPPTAIIAASDDIAAGVMAVAHERGLNLPADLSVTGYDDTDMARKLWPALTTVHHPVEQMAEEATRRLVALMRPARHAEPSTPAQLELRGELVLRQSLAAPGRPAR
ncbi:LacI family DNA-binding transcriptional regulator [Aquabacterium sp.]|uniref:LacI family DNA-binding transcriptional regulator n=1 Tax=Aquabacterium sp. TaxID=1872578 RepID=UPI002CAC3B16|nr:LacI family DNA-binding transcriptional regulator [Aquabacterium sp.]HSW05896.1 LacI family DNA-binding transcriptional regulator [Aquabacterium sp.]